MKKLLLTASIVLLMSAGKTLAGDTFSTPRGEPQALATADYAGVLVATSAFPVSGTGVNAATACVNSDSFTCSGVFYGVVFSSGNAGAYDFVDVFDATSTDKATAQGAFMRLYNVAGSSMTSIANASAASGFSGPPKPVRFKQGLITRPGSAAYNQISTLFYLFRENKSTVKD